MASLATHTLQFLMRLMSFHAFFPLGDSDHAGIRHVSITFFWGYKNEWSKQKN